MREPLVPVSVRVNGPPGVACAVTEKVNMEFAEPPDGGVTCGRLKLAVTPGGGAVMLNWTGWLKPLTEYIVIVELSDFPCSIVKEVGEGTIAKSAVGVDETLGPGYVPEGGRLTG